jgi:hypothetical protein
MLREHSIDFLRHGHVKGMQIYFHMSHGNMEFPLMLTLLFSVFRDDEYNIHYILFLLG